MKVLKNTDGFYAYFISKRSSLSFGKFLTCSPKTFPSISLELTQSHETKKFEFCLQISEIFQPTTLISGLEV